ncbi:MAG: glycosyltransferase family 2 protein [Bacteroidota bacterium]
MNDHKPLVSIGVPAYNGEKYLEECLDSILKQSYSNWECVISNNSSTDNTAGIAEKYVKSDPRFKLFHTRELLPISENWNFCYSLINKDSRYFKLLPADDWITPEFISEMVRVMEKHEEVGICSSIRLVDKELRGEGLDFYKGNRFNGKDILIRQLKQELNVTSSINSVLYRNESLKKLSFFPEIFQDESFHQDTYLSYELLMQSDLGFVFQVLSYTRRHDDSVTSTVTSRLNTRLYFREFSLYHYKSIDPFLETEYRKVRIRYAYFMLKSWLFSRKASLEWHRNRLKRPIRIGEYLKALFRRFR